MIFKNAELYNISELVDSGDGSFYMLRMPKAVEEKMDSRGQPLNRNNCGVEIRFNLIGESAKIVMCALPGEVEKANVYYGSIPSGWEECVKNIYDHPTEIIITNPYNTDELKRISKDNNFPFDSNLVRLILPNKRLRIIDIQGDITPPEPSQTPKLHYLAYGSSITHGSIGLSAPNTYAFRTAENLDADLINLGFAGSARLEPAIADFISTRKDWDFATIEMGVNILNIEPEDYRTRITYYINTIAKNNLSKKVFCIDVFYNQADFIGDNKAPVFRKIMKETIEKLNLPNVVYINGLSILDSAAGLTADMVHPNNRAIPEMGKKLANIIKNNL